MSSRTYARYEAIRLMRNRQNWMFSLIIPLVLYFAIAGPQKHDHNFGGDATHYTGLFAPQYYMTGLLAFGVMAAILSGGARIAAERTIGWNRQMRLTPLSTRTYLVVKLAIGYATAAAVIILMFVAGISLGVRLPAATWFEMTGLILLALTPFAGLGIAFGHLLTSDGIGPALGGGVSFFAFFGGSYFPITGDGVLAQISKALPSHWLVKAGQVSSDVHNPWGVEGWLVIAIWSAVMIGFAGWAYRRDTHRA